MTHFIINDTKFNSEYIDFGSNTNVRGPGLIPTRECFVHVWQRSNNLPEFHNNMENLHELWEERRESPLASYDRGLILTTAMVNYRLATWRDKGVKLKELLTPPEPDEWEVLADIADSSVITAPHDASGNSKPQRRYYVEGLNYLLKAGALEYNRPYTNAQLAERVVDNNKELFADKRGGLVQVAAEIGSYFSRGNFDGKLISNFDYNKINNIRYATFRKKC